MRVVTCPRCKRASLTSNGSYWSCAFCGLAITLTALIMERRHSRQTEEAPTEGLRILPS
jgi:hypothetical protein